MYWVQDKELWHLTNKKGLSSTCLCGEEVITKGSRQFSNAPPWGEPICVVCARVFIADEAPDETVH